MNIPKNPRFKNLTLVSVENNRWYASCEWRGMKLGQSFDHEPTAEEIKRAMLVNYFYPRKID